MQGPATWAADLGGYDSPMGLTNQEYSWAVAPLGDSVGLGRVQEAATCTSSSAERWVRGPGRPERRDALKRRAWARAVGDTDSIPPPVWPAGATQGNP